LFPFPVDSFGYLSHTENHFGASLLCFFVLFNRYGHWVGYRD